MKHSFIIHTDGGARGNPGPAAAGVIISAIGGPPPKDGQAASGGDGSIGWKKEFGEYLGEITNNEAEYRAVVIALKKLKHLIGSEKAKDSRVEIHVDSELLEKQMNGEYKIKDETIKNLFIEIWNLKTDFGEVVFKHIPREENTDADMVVNQILDREANKLKL